MNVRAPPLAWAVCSVAVAVAAVALVDGTDAFWALAVAALAFVVFGPLFDGDLEIAAYGAAVGAVFVAGPLTAAGAAVLLVLLGAARLLRSPFILAAGAAGILLPGSTGAWVLAGSVALLVGWTGSGMRPGRDAVRLGLAALITGVGVFVGDPFWAAPLGAAAGLAGRALAGYPANLRAGRSVEGGAALAGLLPGVAVVVLAAVDRLPAVDDLTLLLAAWGSVALGLGVYALGVGVEALLRTPAPSRGALVAAAVAAGLLMGVAALAAGPRQAALALAVLWPVCAGPVAVGAVRILRTLRVRLLYRVGWASAGVFALAALRGFQ